MTTPSTSTHTPLPYYATTNTEDVTAHAAHKMRVAELNFWQLALPALDEDFPLYCEKLAVQSSVDPGRIEKIFFALYRLEELPRFAALVWSMGHINMDRLIAIDQVLSKLGMPPADVLERIDNALTDYLTPSKPHEVLPSRGQIRRRLRDIISALDDTIATRDKRVKPSYTCDTHGPQSTISLNDVDNATAAIIDQHIRFTAKEHNLSLLDAAVQLLTGNIKPSAKVVLHTYQATDVEAAPTFIAGYGWSNMPLDPNVIRDFSRPLSPAHGYRFPETMRAFIEGRDGTCRFPNCSRPAAQCQIDHRINYSEGGPTHPDNGVCLCQHHHNIKTDGRVFYVLDPITGDIYWLFSNGTWAATSPTGPLSPVNKRWVQSTAQAIISTRTNYRRAAQKLKIELEGEMVEIFDVSHSHNWAVDYEDTINDEEIPF